MRVCVCVSKGVHLKWRLPGSCSSVLYLLSQAAGQQALVILSFTVFPDFEITRAHVAASRILYEF